MLLLQEILGDAKVLQAKAEAELAAAVPWGGRLGGWGGEVGGVGSFWVVLGGWFDLVLFVFLRMEGPVSFGSSVWLWSFVFVVSWGEREGVLLDMLQEETSSKTKVFFFVKGERAI